MRAGPAWRSSHSPSLPSPCWRTSTRGDFAGELVPQEVVVDSLAGRAKSVLLLCGLGVAVRFRRSGARLQVLAAGGGIDARRHADGRKRGLRDLVPGPRIAVAAGVRADRARTRTLGRERRRVQVPGAVVDRERAGAVRHFARVRVSGTLSTLAWAPGFAGRRAAGQGRRPARARGPVPESRRVPVPCVGAGCLRLGPVARDRADGLAGQGGRRAGAGPHPGRLPARRRLRGRGHGPGGRFDRVRQRRGPRAGSLQAAARLFVGRACGVHDLCTGRHDRAAAPPTCSGTPRSTAWPPCWLAPASRP